MGKIKSYLKIYLIVIAIFIAAAAVFYLAVGEQLYFRKSIGTIEKSDPNEMVGELTEDVKIEQYFTADIQYMDKIGILLSNYDKEILGDVKIGLYDADSGVCLSEGTISPNDIGLNEYAYLPVQESRPSFQKRQMKLVLTSESGKEGNSATALYQTEKKQSDWSLFINGEPVSGALCFTVEGRDEVWTGRHFFLITGVFLLLLSAVYIFSAFRYERGSGDLFFSLFYAFRKYSFLINQLVARDFKVRYKRSFLGVLWSLLNPLLTMTVQYLVFSQLFRSDIDNFPVYMLTGLVIFNFFTEAVGLSLGAIVWNSSLITKVYVPKYMYPITKVLSSTINFMLSLIPIFIGMVLTGEAFTKALLLLPFLLVCVIVFTMGLSILLSALMVFFRDIQFLWGIISMLWMYLTALFYPASIIPENLRWVLDYNPMYCYVTFARTLVMEGVSPEPKVYVICVLYAAGSLMLGSLVFKKLQDQFVLNL